MIGCLTAEGEVDMERSRELIDAAGEMSVTFHRAFDMCHDPFDSLEKIISLGCHRILTSGQQQQAEQGVPLLKDVGATRGRPHYHYARQWHQHEQYNYHCKGDRSKGVPSFCKKTGRKCHDLSQSQYQNGRHCGGD